MANIINILLILQVFLLYVQSDDKLIAVNLLYRHGDRTPLKFFPNDKYQDLTYWPLGLGELTNIGKEQHFQLGKWFRERYNDSLSSVYDKDEIYIRSSNSDRCLMSAESNLAGLYPPVDKDAWLDNMPWQPIPVHTTPEKYDDIAEIYSSCPKYNQLLGEALQLSYFKDIQIKYKNVYDTLSKNTGMEVTNLIQAQDIYTTLLIEKNNNLKIPKWADDIFEQLKELRDISCQLLTYTPNLRQLFIGRYFDNIKNQFEKIDQKFKMFSAHDDQVYSILNVLNVPNIEAPPYAATVIFELYEPKDKTENYVQVFYKTDKLETLKICDGVEKCTLKNFLKSIKPLWIDEEDFLKACAL